MSCKEYQDNGGKGELKEGVLTIKLSAWNEFYTTVQKTIGLGEFIWRGHNWTYSPFVAAYFAFVKDNKNSLRLSNKLMKDLRENLKPELMKELEKEIAEYGQTENRIIYGLSEDLVRWGPKVPNQETSDKHYVEFVDSKSDENKRLLSQNGLFTKALKSEEDIKTRVKRCYSADVGKGKDRVILIEIAIPNKEREICLKSLNQMNINHATLFPDLYGASIYCNLKLEINGY